MKLLCTLLTICIYAQSLAQAPGKVQWWMTLPDSSRLLQQQAPLSLGKMKADAGTPIIRIDASKQYQVIDGFGYTLTGGSAVLINQLPQPQRVQLLRELFGNGKNSIGVSYLRLSIGASDLDSVVFSYDDMPASQTDTALRHFSLKPDMPNLVPLLKEIVSINPAIKIIAAPWSSPVWMKSNDSTKGGVLRNEYYGVYAKYFVRYIQAMAKQGIRITAVTPQNEPLNPKNNPSLVMEADQQATFIRDHLGPAFIRAGLKTLIVTYDHNCDRPDYPLAILKDAKAKQFVDGSAFHLYGGEESVMTDVHNQYPDKKLYFTEQYTPSNGVFGGDFSWHIAHVIIGTMRNWSSSAMEWNLANDPGFGPHTPGGCTTCKGALTIDGKTVNRNAGFYIIAHASKFVQTGSYRVESNMVDGLNSVAFKTPAGKKVLIVQNTTASLKEFIVEQKGSGVKASLPTGAVATFVW
jgi:glucosylceramidase